MWRHFLQLTLRIAGCCQPVAQRNPKLTETNNSVPWTVLLNSPPQAFGRWGKRLFLHHSPCHSRAFRNITLKAVSQTPGMHAGRRGSSCRQEEHAKEPCSAKHLHHTKPILGNTNVHLFHFSASEENLFWIWGQTGCLQGKRSSSEQLMSAGDTVQFVRVSSASSSAKSSF